MKSKQHKLRIMVFLTGLMIAFSGALIQSASEPQYVPLGPESAGLWMQNALVARMVPYRMESNGLQLTVNKLLEWAIDWKQGKFTMKCSFTAGTSGTMLELRQDGAITLTGSLIFSAPEQKIGFRLLRIDGLELDHTNPFLSEAVRVLIDRGLAGKEFWSGTPPVSSQILTDANFSKLLEMVVSRQLPLEVRDGKSSIVMNRLEEMEFLEEPGKMRVKLNIQGVYHKIFNWKFDGWAQVELRMEVDPSSLAGIVRIEALKDIKLKGTPFWVNHWIRGLINSRIRGQVFRFNWE